MSAEDWELGDGTDSERRTAGGFAVLPCFAEVESDRSNRSPFARIAELRGLSVFPEPGILDRRERKDREDSLVSDLLNEGYDCRFSGTARSPLPPGFDDPTPASLDGWLPIISRNQNVAEALDGEKEGLDGVRVQVCGSG